MNNNYISPKELRAIADYCESLAPLWEAVTFGPRDGIYIESDEAPTLHVYDSNGESLGIITWGDDGAAFFPKVSND